jgi:hypothetical protein
MDGMYIVTKSYSEVDLRRRDASADLLAQEIDGKDAKEVSAYAKVFWQKWHTLPGG